MLYKIVTVTEKTLDFSLPFTEYESKTLVITVPSDYKQTVSGRILIPDLSQITTPFTEVKNQIHCYNTSLNDEKEIQEASGSDLATVKSISINLQ